MQAERSSGCLVPILVLVAVAGVGGFLVHRYVGFDKILDKLRPRQHADAKIIDPSTLHKPKEEKKAPPPVVTNVVVEIEEPEQQKKTIPMMQAEADKAQKALDQEIAKARSADAKSLPGFAGIRFGNVIDGPAISLERLPDCEKYGDEGLCCLMFGPKLAKAFNRFGTQPMVYATPKTHKVFRIEFSRPIERVAGWKLNPDTTNLVQDLTVKLKRTPFSLDVSQLPLAKREFVFPIGESTITVGEYGGTQLKLIVEHAGIRASAAAETEAVRKESRGESANMSALTSDKYPNGGMVKFGRVRMKKGTPKSFCGIVFGSLPPYSARIITPPSSTAAHCFYVDYRTTKCKPFMNFIHGKAELSGINGAVTAVSLFCNEPDNGLTDAEYFEKARQAIEHKFKAKPTAEEGDGPVKKLTYSVGSLEITLGPDPQSGFYLKAVNTTLKEAW